MDIGYILEEAMNREKSSIQASISYLEDYLMCDPVFEKYIEYKNKLTIQNKAKLKEEGNNYPLLYKAKLYPNQKKGINLLFKEG